MPRRIYGSAVVPEKNQDKKDVAVSSVSPVENKRIRVMPVSENDIFSDTKKDPEKVKHKMSDIKASLTRNKVRIFAGVLCTLVLCVVSLTIWLTVFDNGNGDVSAENVARRYSEDLVANSDNVWRCFPPAVRDKQFVASDSMWTKSSLFEDVHVYAIDIESSNTTDISNHADKLKTNFKKLYAADLDSDELKLVSQKAKLKYTKDNSDMEEEVSYDVVCFRKGPRWYVYTAGVEGIKDINLIPNVAFFEETSGESKEQPEEFDYAVPAVRTYPDVFSDLSSGTFEINDAEYVVPDSYSAFSSLFCLKDDLIDEKDRIISYGDVLTDLPVAFKDDEYTGADITIDIANTKKDDVDIKYGTVNSLYIGKKLNVKGKYPKLILPGNVTIGTSKAAVEYVYGQLIAYKNFKKDSLFASLCELDDISVYNMRFPDSEYNYIYFVFDSKDSLVGVRWSYYDLTKL